MPSSMKCYIASVKQGDDWVTVQSNNKADIDLIRKKKGGVILPPKRNTLEVEEALSKLSEDELTTLQGNLAKIADERVNLKVAEALVPNGLGRLADTLPPDQLKALVQKTAADLSGANTPSPRAPVPDLKRGGTPGGDANSMRARQEIADTLANKDGRAATALEDNSMVMNNPFIKGIVGVGSFKGLKIKGRRYGAFQLSPKLANQTSPSPVTQQINQLIANNEYLLVKETKGIAKTSSLEGMAVRWQGVLGDSMEMLDRQYSTYAKRVKSEGGDIKSRRDFGTDISRHLRSKQESGIPELDAAVADINTKIFEYTTSELRSQGLLDPKEVDMQKAYRGYKADMKRAKTPKGDVLEYDDFSQQVIKYARNEGKDGSFLHTKAGQVYSGRVMEGAKLSVIGAEGYVPRFYKFDLIMQRQAEFERDLITFMTSPEQRNLYGTGGKALSHKNAVDLAKQIKGSILGLSRKTGVIPDDIIATAGPLKDRVVNVPDEVLERWIENDIDTILARYMREIAPQIEASRMGLSHKYIQDSVNADYERLITEAGDDIPMVEELGKRRDLDLTNTGHMFNQAMGQLEGELSPGLSTAAGVARDLNFMRLLGNVVPSSLADMGRHVHLAGFSKPIGFAMRRMNKEFRKMSEESLRSIGGASEMWLNNRINALLGDEIGMHTNVNWLRQISGRGSQIMGKYSGIQRWNHENKVLAGLLSQDALVRQIKLAGKTGSKADYDKLAVMGIARENADELVEAFKGVKPVNGVYMVNLHDFADTSALHQFQTSILKDIERTIVTPGIGDKPRVMTTEAGSTMLQFRSFQFAALNKMLIPLAQDPAAMNHITGTATMLMVGGMAASSKMYLAGRGDEWEAMSAQEMTREALDNSGLLGIYMEAFNIADKTSGGKLSQAMGMSGTATRYRGRQIFESFLGPTFGMGQDITDAIFSLSGNTEYTQADFHRMRKLMPYSNIFYLRWLVDRMELEAGEAMGLKQNTNVTPAFIGGPQ